LITALVPGTFDPPTNGHIDVIARCATLFDRVVVAVAHNPTKQPLFSAEERVALIGACCSAWPNVESAHFDGLLVDFVQTSGADVIVKGLRAMTDFEYELQLAQMNRHLSGTMTMFMATKPELGYLSSSMVKEVAGLGGSVQGLVPDLVAEALKRRFADER
jgi:pantetheine-phosphate adenylyltransferase